MSRTTIDKRLIAQVLALRKRGWTQNEIAVEVGRVQSTVSIILRQHGVGGRLVSITPRKRA